jgi:predicted dehydrogenase
MTNNRLEMLLIGAGGRGTHAYAPYALKHPEALSFTAVAEPDPARRAHFAAQHEIEPENQFESWEEALAAGRHFDAVLNCTMDRMHVESTLVALRAGYHVLLEKPMAINAEDCRLLVETAEMHGRILQICHVLRYTSFFKKVHEIVQSGRLGRVMTIDHRENVSTWHMSHSFVRGNWRNEAQSAPMILAKCCHDMDILVWLTGQRVKSLSSFGALTHYRAENAPPGAPQRCTDSCPVADSCVWYAPRLYGALPEFPQGNGFMVYAMGGSGMNVSERFELLKTSPYGRCVYRCDNDVVDHQVVNMLFENGLTATFTMHGHSDREGRSFRWDGTRATMFGEFGENMSLRVIEHGSLKEDVIHFEEGDDGHGGGDSGLIHDFVEVMAGRPSPQQTTARVSLESHLMCFAAEESRKRGVMIDMENFR